MTLIKFDHVRKKYIPFEYNFIIKKDDIIILDGENGRGKTTLIHLLLKFIKPDSGKIISKNLKVSYVSEEQTLPVFMTGNEYLKELERIKRGKKDDELINELKVPLNKPIKDLSRGNRQKLILIGSFIGNNDMLIFDEPTHSLDVSSINIFTNYLEKLKSKTTMLIVTHDKEPFYHLEPTILKI